MFFPEKIRKALKEMKETSRGKSRNLRDEWAQVFLDLEISAQLRDATIKSIRAEKSPTPRQVLAKLRKRTQRINHLIKDLEDPSLLHWNFRSEDRRSWLRQGDTPSRLIIHLVEYRHHDLSPQIELLDKFTRGRRTQIQSVQEADELFIYMLIRIGLDVFGQVGDHKGPFVKFVSLAAKTVLKKAPKRAALRSRARRVAKSLKLPAEVPPPGGLKSA
jgi:hypothetical protein